MNKSPLNPYQSPAYAVALEPAAPVTLAERAERAARLTGYTRLTSIGPSKVGSTMQYFEMGYLQHAAPVMEKVMAYDGVVSTVAPKRWRAVSGTDWEVATVDDSEEARRQADYLDDFLHTLVTREAEAMDAGGGVESLIYHLIQAQAFKYSAAEILWNPATTAKGESTYHAELIACPTRYFEATTRRLRILTHTTSLAGEDLDERNWLVAVAPGTPLMLPTLLLFMLKMTPLEDWAVTVETFAVPFLIAKTGARKGDPEWAALEMLVANAKNRFGAVVGSDTSVEVTNGLTQTNSPHKELIEYIDRAIVSLWRGGDLSTMSQSGDGVGANPQQEEMAALAKSDRKFIEGVLAGLGERFLRLVFGENTTPKAYFKFSETEDEAAAKLRVEQLRQAWDMGLAIPENFVRSTLGIPAVAEGDKVVQNLALKPAVGAPGAFANALSDLFTEAQTERNLAEAEAFQFSGVREWLDRLSRAADEDEFRALLKEFRRKFPGIAARVLSRDDVAKALNKALGVE